MTDAYLHTAAQPPHDLCLQGLAPLEGCQGETHTTGLDTLRTRCHQYYQYGCCQAGWGLPAVCKTKLTCWAGHAGKGRALPSGGQLCQLVRGYPAAEP